MPMKAKMIHLLRALTFVGEISFEFSGTPLIQLTGYKNLAILTGRFFTRFSIFKKFRLKREVVIMRWLD